MDKQQISLQTKKIKKPKKSARLLKILSIKRKYKNSYKRHSNKPKFTQLYKSTLPTLKPQVLIDLSFTSKMHPKEIVSLCHQLQQCQGLNKKYFPSSVNFQFVGIDFQLKSRLAANNHALQWGIEITEEKIEKGEWNGSQIVYLTADAQEEINELDKDKVYVIGGLVDHNRLKKLTYNFCQEKNIAMQKFPLSKYVKLKCSQQLAINHVFEIILKKNSGLTWKESFKQTIPQRKVQEYLC